MSETICTYDELKEQRKNLEILLEAQGQLIRLELEEIKEEIRPVQETFSSISEFVTRDKTTWVLDEGLNFLVDTLVKDFILSGSGRLTKFITAELIKNYASGHLAIFQQQISKGIGALMEFEPEKENGTIRDEA